MTLPDSMQIRLACENITKEYRATTGPCVRALEDVTFAIAEGEFLTVVGSSGSGKSTLLRILARIESPTTGKVTDFRSEGDGRIGFVFQGESVFPWRTVERNLSYSMEARGVGARKDRARRAAELCALVGLAPDAFLNKYPRELSGGEARRVAIGMALSAGASLLLFDEPTAQLDYVSRLRLQATIQSIWADKHPTVVYVTHDIEEAILLGSRIAVLGGGRLKELICVDLPRPRGPETIGQATFVNLRQSILRHLDVAS